MADFTDPSAKLRRRGWPADRCAERLALRQVPLGEDLGPAVLYGALCRRGILNAKSTTVPLKPLFSDMPCP
jgi:hypothetical protein